MADQSTTTHKDAAPGVRPPTQARRSTDYQLGPNDEVSDALAPVRAWIQANQTVAVLGAFAVGVFMGSNMRG